MTSVNVFRKKASKYANAIVSNPDVSSLLEDPGENWSSLSRKLTLVADMVPDGVLNESTILGKSSGFLSPFRESIEVFRALYSTSSWCRNVENRIEPMTTDPITTKERFQDASFSEKVELVPGSKIIVIGDIHADIHSFAKIIDSLFDRGIIREDLSISRGYHLIFLGDIVDRGVFGLDILHVVFRIKNRNIQSVHLLNGNHEDVSMYQQYGFNDELESQLENPEDRKIVHELLTYLPTALLVNLDDKWFQFNHAGISQGYHPLNFMRSEYELEFHGYDTPGNLVNVGLRWNDFNGNITDTAPSTWRLSGKDVLEYGYRATETYLVSNDLVGIIRGHRDTVSSAFMTKQGGSRRDMGVIEGFGMLYPTEHRWSGPVSDGWEHISIADAFKDYSVVTTSTAVRNKGVAYYTYLEIGSTKEEIQKHQSYVMDNIEKYLEFARDIGVEDVLRHLINDDLLSKTHVAADKGRWDMVVQFFKSENSSIHFPLLVLDSLGSIR